MTTRQCSTSSLLQRYCSETMGQNELLSVLKARMTRLALFWLGWPWLSGSQHTVSLHQAKLLSQGVLILFCGKAVTWDLPKKVAFTSQLAWEGKCNSSVIPFSCLYWFCMWTKEEQGHYHTSLLFNPPPPFFLKQHLKGAKWKWNTQLSHRS